MLIYIGGVAVTIPFFFINKDATLSIVAIVIVYFISTLISSLFVPLCVLFTILVILRINYTKDKKWFRNIKAHMDNVSIKTKFKNSYLSNTIIFYLDNFIENYCNIRDIHVDDSEYKKNSYPKKKKVKKQVSKCLYHDHHCNKNKFFNFF